MPETCSDKSLPVVGDVIMSKLFKFGHYKDGKDKSVVVCGCGKEKYLVGCVMGEEERVALAAKTGQIPPKRYDVDLSAYARDRAECKFVVESAYATGGGSDSIRGESWPDGWFVRARRLNADGTHNPSGELIEFFMTGCFSEIIKPKEVVKVGSMSQTFTVK